MLNNDISQLFTLIKETVTDTDICSAGEFNWSNIAGISKRQGVSAMILDALESLKAEQRPQNPLLMRWVVSSLMVITQEEILAFCVQCRCFIPH